MIIEFDGIPIEVTKKRIKNINLRVYPPDGLVKMSAPLHYKQPTIYDFLHKQRAWIHHQRQRLQSLADEQNSTINAQTIIPFKGMDYTLITHEHHGPTQVIIRDSVLECYLPHNSGAKYQQIILDRWYTQEMALLIPDLMQHWSAKINVVAYAWRIKKMKTRWGSCNTKNKIICLNMNLMKKPFLCLEYVLVHELVHLLEASHNKRFYSLMDQFMPKWREADFLLEGRKSRK